MAGHLKQSTSLVHDRFLAVIKANPGIHIRQISMLTGLCWNTVEHHLRTMARLGRVTELKIDGKVCWFDRTAGAVEGKAAVFLLRDPRNRLVVQRIVDSPGGNQRRVAAALGLAPSIIHRRVVKLEEAGLVERVPGSTSMALFPSPRLAALAAEEHLATES